MPLILRFVHGAAFWAGIGDPGWQGGTKDSGHKKGVDKHRAGTKIRIRCGFGVDLVAGCGGRYIIAEGRRTFVLLRGQNLVLLQR